MLYAVCLRVCKELCMCGWLGWLRECMSAIDLPLVPAHESIIVFSRLLCAVTLGTDLYCCFFEIAEDFVFSVLLLTFYRFNCCLFFLLAEFFCGTQTTVYVSRAVMSQCISAWSFDRIQSLSQKIGYFFWNWIFFNLLWSTVREWHIHFDIKSARYIYIRRTFLKR